MRRRKVQKAEKPPYPQGEILEGPEQGIYKVGLDDGRILTGYVSGNEMGRVSVREWLRIMPRVGDRVWVEIIPGSPDWEIPERARIRLRYGVIRKGQRL